MTYPAFDTSRIPEGDHAARPGPVTCAACGCRLEHGTAAGRDVWHHFSPMGGRDARGCRVDCVDAPHDASGYALEAAAA